MNRISYCVKEKKKTECVPGSEVYKKPKNGATMMLCKCASCGIKKTKFVRQQEGDGIVGDFILRNVGKAAYQSGKDILKEEVRKFPEE